MRARLVALLLCPALVSCSLFMQLDKDKLEYFDEHVDVEEDFHEEGAPDIPSDFEYDGPCPDAPECWAHDDCFDGDPCTMDYCYMECGACVNTFIEGAVSSMEDMGLQTSELWSEDPPRIAFSGIEFGVVWAREPNPDNGEIFFSTVAADGSSHSAEPYRVTDNARDDGRPGIVWSGSQWLVAWVHRPEAGGQVLVSAIQPSPVLISDPIIIAETGGHMSSLDIIEADGQVAIAHDTFISPNNAMVFQLLEGDGTPIGTPLTVDLEGTHMTLPSLAWNGTQWGLVWQDEREGFDETGIYYASINADGTAVETPVPVVTTGSYANRKPSLAWSGTAYGLTYHRQNAVEEPEIYFQLLAPDGSPVGSEMQLTNSDEGGNESPDLAFTGSEFGLLYNASGALALFRLNTDGSFVSENIDLNDPAHPVMGTPAIVWNGYSYAVSWEGHEGEWFNMLGLCAP
jgi:hypothetical protein